MRARINIIAKSKECYSYNDADEYDDEVDGSSSFLNRDNIVN